MKFGGSSLSSAERMREGADLIISFPDENPVVVLSAMGKTTNNLLNAGEKAVSCGVSRASDIPELKDLDIRTLSELGIDISTISSHLEELEQLLKGIAMMKELTLRIKDYLVSFGECMSTRIFAAYMNKIGAKARQAFHVPRTSNVIVQMISQVASKVYISLIVNDMMKQKQALRSYTMPSLRVVIFLVCFLVANICKWLSSSLE